MFCLKLILDMGVALMRNKNILIGSLLLAMTIISACGGSSHSSSYNALKTNSMTDEAALAGASSTLDMSFGSMAAKSYDDTYAPEMYEESIDDVDTDIKQANLEVKNSNLKLIRNVSIDLHTKEDNIAETLNTFASKTNELGGYFSNKQIDNQNSWTRGSIVLRIPSENVDAFLDFVNNTPLEVVSLSDNTEDVTLQYADVETRIAVLKQKRDNYMEYLKQATDIDETLKVEDALTRVVADLESQESQMRVLSNKINYSTISITISFTKFAPNSLGDRWVRTWESAVEDIQYSLMDLVELFTGDFIMALGIVVFFVIVLKFTIFLLRVFKILKPKQPGDRNKSNLIDRLRKRFKTKKETPNAQEAEEQKTH